MDWLWHTLTDSLKSNQFLAGGLVLGIVGGLIAWMRRLPSFLVTRLMARFTTVVDVANSDPLYGWLADWMAAHPHTARIGLLTAVTKSVPVDAASIGRLIASPNGSLRPAPTSTDGRSDFLTVMLSPAPGVHWFWSHGCLIIVGRERRERTNNEGFTTYLETMTLRFVSPDRDVPRRFLDDVKALAMPSDVVHVPIYAADYGSWSLASRVRSRPLDSLVLDDALQRDISEAVDRFIESRERYHSLGIPYHLGLLLHGPPGAGKTSWTLAMAARLGFSIYVLSLETEATDATRLRQLLSFVTPQSILVIEDIDRDSSAATQHETPPVASDLSAAQRIEVSVARKTCLSALLNGLDGITTPDGMIVVMTANHPEWLDPALRRPGRIDHEFLFPNATSDTARRLFLRFFPDQDAYAEEFAVRVGAMEAAPSMASLQGHLLKFTDAAAAVFIGDTAKEDALVHDVRKNGHHVTSMCG